MNPLVYLPLILAVLILTIAVVVGVFKLGTPGDPGMTGPIGPTGTISPAQYQPMIVEGNTWLGNNYNGRMFIVYHNRMDITARNTVAGDNFIVVNPNDTPLLIYHQHFVSPVGPVTLPPLTQTQFFVSADSSNNLSFTSITQPLSQKITAPPSNTPVTSSMLSSPPNITSAPLGCKKIARNFSPESSYRPTRNR